MMKRVILRWIFQNQEFHKTLETAEISYFI